MLFKLDILNVIVSSQWPIYGTRSRLIKYAKLWDTLWPNRIMILYLYGVKVPDNEDGDKHDCTKCYTNDDSYDDSHHQTCKQWS